MIVRFDNDALKKRKTEASIGVAGDKETAPAGTSEADAIVTQAKKHQEETGEVLAMVNADAIAEEQEEEANTAPGPELNLEAAKAAQKNPRKTQRNEKS
jgi:protein phosphatase PTC1